jgi:energy-coupling factor transporter ATP-binding protein EcfA2
MSVKDARFEDHWRHVFARHYRTKVTEVHFKDLFCLANGSVNFSGGISAIVGPNGVGKSTLIAAIADLMANEDSPIETGLQRRVCGSEVGGTVLVDGTEVHLHVQSGPDGSRIRTGGTYNGEFRYLDPSNLGLRCLSQIYADLNFSDLLEAIDPVQLSEEELNTASYLVGKTYSAVLIYEIADYAGFDRFPYFRVTSAGISY